MAARVFVIPRCVQTGGPQDTFQATLEAAGRDMLTAFVIKRDKGYGELVTLVETNESGSRIYRREDGTCFTHPVPAVPEAA